MCASTSVGTNVATVAWWAARRSRKARTSASGSPSGSSTAASKSAVNGAQRGSDQAQAAVLRTCSTRTEFRIPVFKGLRSKRKRRRGSGGVVRSKLRFAELRQVHATLGDTDGLDLGAEQVGHAEQKVRRRLVDGRLDVPVARQAAVGAAQERGRHVVPIVQQAVAHAGAEVDQRAVEQRAVAVRRVLELGEE